MSSLSVVVLVLLGLVAHATAGTPLTEEENQYLFVAWTKEHGKVYTHDEFFPRFATFKQNLAFVRAHNAGKHSFTLAMNKFADMTSEEFKAKMTGLVLPRPGQRPEPNKAAVNVSIATLPAAVDWRKENAVTAVKDQGQCGSCWAFSATGSMEGAVAIKHGQLHSLSEQQLVDCSTAEGNHGCEGGWMDYAFTYVIKHKGLCSESAYPYKATGPNTCEASRCATVATVASYDDVPARNNDALHESVAAGPVAVAIEADTRVFQLYSSGVLDSAACGTRLDHGVLAVGYDTDAASGKPYWIVKNSWGKGWGDQGYVWIRRDTGSSPGICGIALAASRAVA